MNILQYHIKSGNFGHAYLLAGDFEEARKLVFEASHIILAPQGKLEAHPDFYYHKYEAFGIEDSHQIRSMASYCSLLGCKKVFAIELVSLSGESANALLKTVEEPGAGTHFFVSVPFKEDILPTLASRFAVVEGLGGKDAVSEELIEKCKKFLGEKPNKRLEMAKKIADEKQEALEFVNGLEFVLAANLARRVPSDSLGTSSSKLIKSLEEIKKCRDIMKIKGSSAKMILEHLALTL